MAATASLRSNGSSLAPPLRLSPDMGSSWRDVDLDFDAAAEQLVRAHGRDGHARDQSILDLRTWAVVPTLGRVAIAPLGQQHGPLRLRTTAFTHLMGRLGAPAEFIRDRLPAPLQLATVNFLLASLGEPMPATLRLRGEEVTAVVSSRYAALDAEELVETVRSTLVDQGVLGDVRVRAVATGVVDVLRLVFPAESATVQVGDVSAVGLDISSSSFGRSALHVRGVVWRLVCSNGLRAPERAGGVSIRHVGEPRRLRDGLGEAVPSVLVHARGVMQRWRRAVDHMVMDVAAQIESLRDLSAAEQKTVEHAVQREVGSAKLPDRVDLFSLLNGITSAAKEAPPSRRIEIEAVAGQLLHARVPS